MLENITQQHLDERAQKTIRRLRAFASEGKKMFLTSSFQTQSLPLLHIISQSGIDIPILFTNTGFLYPETVTFAEQISKRLNLRLISVKSEVPKINQRDNAGRFLYASDPDYCCHINKVKPLEIILAQNDIWINGIRADQSSVRAEMSEFENATHDCLRYHPMLEWDSKMVFHYRKLHDLPEHPLEAKGYVSVGCEPCTVMFAAGGNARNSRWFGLNKTECGINTTLIHKE